jgi:hypothetical protein
MLCTADGKNKTAHVHQRWGPGVESGPPKAAGRRRYVCLESLAACRTPRQFQTVPFFLENDWNNKWLISEWLNKEPRTQWTSCLTLCFQTLLKFLNFNELICRRQKEDFLATHQRSRVWTRTTAGNWYYVVSCAVSCWQNSKANPIVTFFLEYDWNNIWLISEWLNN